jgi:predicted helicase
LGHLFRQVRAQTPAHRGAAQNPVIHFYEDFLKAYDKKRKVQRGVFYTPQPVVSYIVRSLHELLQTEFGLKDGLASTATWRDAVAGSSGRVGGVFGAHPFGSIGKGHPAR